MAATKKVDKIIVRMYRVGTGDFFLLQFKKASKTTYNLMIDCGRIKGGLEDFADKIEHLADVTGGAIDLLIVTHEHADHINGFQKASNLFDKINFKKVWFAWTEADEAFANAFRREHAEVKKAVKKASQKLHALINDTSFSEVFGDEWRSPLMMKAAKHFSQSLTGLSELAVDDADLATGRIPTMEDILRKYKVIKEGTVVEFYEPGHVIEDLAGAEGIRFLVLGPPKHNDYIKKEEIKGEGYEKREKKSTVEMALLKILDDTELSESDLLPFEKEYILHDPQDNIAATYYDPDHKWRTIDHDWLFSVGSLALRHQSSINNTSFAVAIQFTDSERILLFPGDAEHGSWLSWHDNLEWSFKDADNKIRKVNAEYILNNTVFYKVSHHLSQNGTPRQKGLEMMTHDDLATMVTLDFEKINSGWLNTMPNDLIGEQLIRKTKGKILFAGDRNKITKNIRTGRVTVSQTHLNNLEKINKPFDGKIFIDYEVTG